MEYINSSLGIPVKGHFHDQYSSRFANATGKEARQQRRQERRENRNTQKVTEGDRREAEEWVMNGFGKALLDAKSIDDIDYWLGVIADQKVDLEMMLGKRKSGVGSVISFGRQYKSRGKNVGLCTSDQCIRTSKARLDALNQFEAKHRTVIATLRKNLEASVATTSPSPTSAPPPSGGSPVGVGDSAGIGTGVSDVADKLKNVASADVNVGGKKFPVKTVAAVAVGAGLVYYFFFRK